MLSQDVLARFCRRHHIVRLSLFDSVLHGNAAPDSDVDLSHYFRNAVLAEASSGIIPDDVPEGANRIIMEREEMTEVTDADAPALAFYVDARQHLIENGFTLAEDNEETLLLATEPMQVDDDLALRIQVHAQPAPGGSELYISSDWANSTTAAPNAWQAAQWTDGMPQEAFEETYTIMYNLSHSDLLFGVQ